MEKIVNTIHEETRYEHYGHLTFEVLREQVVTGGKRIMWHENVTQDKSFITHLPMDYPKKVFSYSLSYTR